ncbi:MAG: ammonium transporter [Sphaerochaetaceae bacterium]
MKYRIFLMGLVMLLCTTGTLFADELSDAVALHQESLDMIWLLVAAALVFFMQAGFAMVEIGLTRAKNAGNIIMKNLMDFCAGSLVFWAIGWALMYGTSVKGMFGSSQFFILGAGSTMFRDWMFQVVFAATAATIVSGAMAERTKFTAYLIYSVIISGLIYPISGHWIWGGGWLSTLGFHDFAGSTVVHSVGGWAALMGTLALGPRIGKYVSNGKKVASKAILGHNLPLASLGVFILWFGWYGFNAGSTLSGTDLTMANVAVTTTLGASAGAIAAMVISWIKFGKPDVSMSLNGALAGLVGITAPTAVVTPTGAIIIGLVAGLLVVFSVEFLDKTMHIDDPVGAISVHGVCGVWGTLAVGLFGATDSVRGLFYGGGIQQLSIQALGALAVGAWVVVATGVLFLVIKKTTGLRVSAHEEMTGLDLSEHSAESYSGFQIFTNM